MNTTVPVTTALPPSSEPLATFAPPKKFPKPPTPVPKLSPPPPLPVLSAPELDLPEAGNSGESDDFSAVTNAAFIAAVFQQLPDGASPAVCTKPGDPNEGGGWPARPAESACLPDMNNNYVACSSFKPSDDGAFKARKEQFAAYHTIMLDDLGTKVPLERISGFELSYLIETSPGNYQGGIILADPVTEGDIAERLLKAIIAAGLCDAGASEPLSRWGRLPNGINGKGKYRTADDNPFQCKLKQWRPDKRYTQQEVIDGLKLVPATQKEDPPTIHRGDDDVFKPKALENPVVSALKARALYKTPLGSGKHDITCPWVHEHTDALDTGAAYFEPDDVYPFGGYCCMHSHREKYHIKELLEYLGVPHSEARHKTVIRIVPGELHRVVDSAELELANLGKHYQSGGLIVTVSTDQVTGDPAIVPTGLSALTRQLSVAATWEKYHPKLEWIRCDPPPRHTSILYDAKTFCYLLPLAGLARQPYFRECDGELVMEAGYDRQSKIFGVFDPRQYVMSDPTLESARSALILLEDLIAEFHFVSPADRAAALSAIFTAVVRPTLAHSPAFHVKAPVFGSGKTYLCELIGAFAGPGLNTKVSYPKSSDEATKVILSLLLKNPAVVEFDDMDSDWVPHGTINRMLTAEQITDRILGVSKTATVSTRSLFLGSGNNVGPVRDLLRRVLTIHIDPRCATPATITYTSSPVDKVRKKRGHYVAAVLTIILAWRKYGSPQAEVESIVTFGGAWSQYCRQPLLWLGHPDPATALLEQVKHDPDGDALGSLLFEWHKAFGSIPTTVRKAVDASEYNHLDLRDAMREFPVEERGEINRSKLGWILKKNANRIVGGLEFQKAEADGRTAWRVVAVKTGGLE